MRRTAAALFAVTALALAGCSGSGDDKPASTPAPSVTSTAPASPPLADQITACTDAITAGKGQDGPECASLSPDDLLTAVQDSNQRGRDALESAIASAAAQ